MRLPALALILTIMLLSGVATAQEYGAECVNSTAREFFTIDNSTRNTWAETCFYGCRAGECMTYSHGAEIYPIAIVCILISLGFLYISVNLSKAHSILGWLFISVGICFAIASLIIIMDVGVWGNTTAVMGWLSYALIIVLIVILLYFFLNIIWNSYKKVIPYGQTLSGTE